MVTKVTGYERPMLLFGLSTDEKPLDVLNGSMFVEMDTSKYYFFSGETSEWLEQAGGGGGDTPTGSDVVGTDIVGTALAG
jgi:hypothetical protein